MKKLPLFLSAVVGASFLVVGTGDAREEGGGGGFRAAPAMSRPMMPARQPVVINMSHGNSGGGNRNFPSQQRARPAAVHAPSYGQLHWNNAPQGQAVSPASRPSVQSYVQKGVKAAVVVHRHPYTQGYVRQKLQKMGVAAEPSYITDRSEIIQTDRAHSTIPFPSKGLDQAPLAATAFSPRHFNDAAVRGQMALVDGGDWRSKVERQQMTEGQAGRYYWHQEQGFNYCHYLDANGYQWYGWYVGNQYFWNRYFNGRWWWYDTDFDRWCFWNGGFWWWQDPYHVGDLYCYNGDSYVPCNSADDQVVVTAPDDASMRSYPSPDGTRVLRIDSQTQDAFLYDTATPPAFDPVYLASGVKSVQFSNPANGRPAEIVLTLNDGSFDVFDEEGTSYNPGNFEADEAAQAQASAGN